MIIVGKETIDGDRLFGLVDASNNEIARPDREAKWHKVPLIRTRLSGRQRTRDRHSWWRLADRAGRRKRPGHFRLSRLCGFDPAVPPGKCCARLVGPLTAERYRKAPIHLLTTASLARLKALHPEGATDPRRFRPNIVVDMAAVEGSFPETEWIGRRLAIGDLFLTISEPCRRCGFTIIGQDGFDHDPTILRSLVRHNAHKWASTVRSTGLPASKSARRCDFSDACRPKVCSGLGQRHA